MQSTPNVKATKATIYLGNIPLVVYQLPDREYSLDTPEITGAIDCKTSDLLRFLKSNSPEALPFKNYNLVYAPTLPVEGEIVFIKPVPVKLATGYWLNRAYKGNIKAQALMRACTAESIERRADQAFNYKRGYNEEVYNERWNQEYYGIILSEQQQEIQERRLPGDDLYYPPDIN